MRKIVFWIIFVLIIVVFMGFFTQNGFTNTINNIQTGIFLGFSVAIGNMLKEQHIEKPYKKLLKHIRKK